MASLIEKLLDIPKYIKENDTEKIEEIIINLNSMELGLFGFEYMLRPAMDLSRIDILKLMIDKGININLVSESGYTILIKALLENNKEIGCFLIENGATLDLENQSIKQFEEYSQEDIIRFLIKNGKDTIIEAALNNHISIAKYLIENNIDINDSTLQESLEESIKHNNTKVAKLLIKNGADVNFKQIYKYEEDKEIISTPLTEAIKLNNIETVKLLIENGADVNFKQIHKYEEDKEIISTPLQKAIKLNNTEIVKLLIENGADVNFKTNAGSLLCQATMFNKCIEIIKLLIENGADVNYELNDITLLVYSVMYNNDIETIKLLIENGADVNYELNDITPLVYSIMYKQDIEIIKLLSEKTKDIDYLALFALILIYDISKDIENLFRENITKDMINESLKELLITKENDIFSSKDMKEMIKEKKSIKNKVKKFKGDVEEIKNIGIETIYDGINNTYQSIENISEQQNDIIDTMNTIDKLDILKKLISDYDVKLDFEDEYKNALIIYASYSDNLEVIEFLVENGNDINHKNIEGCTPLSIAYKQYNIEIVEYLIKQRADVNIILENGKTLYESAKFNDNKELIELIENSPTFIQINPQRLVQILTNFTVDKPMKYTTHSWDFGELSKKYKDFDGYLNAVKSQWDGIKDELKELSPNLYQKVYNFLWETDSNKSLGWSSIDGLKEWCDNGNKPHNFKINDKNFEDIINEFKHQIEIRKNDNILENIFIQQRKKLGRKFKVELIKLKGKTFYTDVEKFKNALDKIFYEISQRQEFQNITVEDSENSRYLEIKITQIDSLSNTSAENMLKEAQDGDFADIKSSLTNLCDWSIESSDENNHYRVNYLKSDNIDDIQILQNKPEGFTHILRVYNK